MAEKESFLAKKQQGAEDGDKSRIAEKRKSSETASEGETQSKKVGFTMGMIKKPGLNKITMNLGGGPPKTSAISSVKSTSSQLTFAKAPKKSATVASAFHDEDSESEEEEMPPEAKMRMKNIGRHTPTAAGPNSFGKGNLGFCDRQRIIQRELQAEADKMEKKTQHK